jgi:hypothetical protein
VGSDIYLEDELLVLFSGGFVCATRAPLDVMIPTNLFGDVFLSECRKLSSVFDRTLPCVTMPRLLHNPLFSRS